MAIMTSSTPGPTRPIIQTNQALLQAIADVTDRLARHCQELTAQPGWNQHHLTTLLAPYDTAGDPAGHRDYVVRTALLITELTAVHHVIAWLPTLIRPGGFDCAYLRLWQTRHPDQADISAPALAGIVATYLTAAGGDAELARAAFTAGVDVGDLRDQRTNRGLGLPSLLLLAALADINPDIDPAAGRFKGVLAPDYPPPA